MEETALLAEEQADVNQMMVIVAKQQGETEPVA